LLRIRAKFGRKNEYFKDKAKNLEISVYKKVSKRGTDTDCFLDKLTNSGRYCFEYFLAFGEGKSTKIIKSKKITKNGQKCVKNSQNLAFGARKRFKNLLSFICFAQTLLPTIVLDQEQLRLTLASLFGDKVRTTVACA